jgi:hypothetical protein
MNFDESWLTFDEEAKLLHNKVSFVVPKCIDGRYCQSTMVGASICRMATNPRKTATREPKW